MRTKIILFILSVSIITNGILGYKFFNTQDAQKLSQEHYPFLSKRIFVDKNDILINFIPLRQALREYVGKQGGEIGVYFEYLPSGSSIGINDTKEIRLASLSKVPTVMEIYKEITRNALREDQLLTVEKIH